MSEWKEGGAYRLKYITKPNLKKYSKGRKGRERLKRVLWFLSMLLVFICVGCGQTLRVIPEGEYVSVKEKENEYFTKAKYIIEEITKEEYEEAKGVNVLIDASTRKNDEKRYLSIKLYILPLEKEEYELVTIKDIKFREGTNHSYHGRYSVDLKDNILYEGEAGFVLQEYNGINTSNGFYIKIDTDIIRYYCVNQEEKNK